MVGLGVLRLVCDKQLGSLQRHARFLSFIMTQTRDIQRPSDGKRLNLTGSTGSGLGAWRLDTADRPDKSGRHLDTAQTSPDKKKCVICW